MKLRFFVVALCLTCSAAFAADTPYANAIKALTPTYYYELNETDVSQDVIDSMGNASEVGVYTGEYAEVPEDAGLGVAALAGCEGPSILNDLPSIEENPDFVNKFGYEPVPVPGVGEGNLAHCSYDRGFIELGPSEEYGASDMTVAMFFRHEGIAGTSGERLFTNNLADASTSFQMNVGGQGLVIGVNPNDNGALAERTLTKITEEAPDGEFDTSMIDENYGWFHVVASTHGAANERAENIRVWINGQERTEDLFVTEWGWGRDTDFAKIGGRRDDGADSTTHSGAQDEVAIWLDRVLTDEEVASIWSAAVGTEPCSTGNGDLDGNGSVEFADFLILSGNFGNSGGAADGDIDCDGEIGFSDFLVLSGNFGTTVGAESVPEPSSEILGLFALVGIGLIRKRR